MPDEQLAIRLEHLQRLIKEVQGLLEVLRSVKHRDAGTVEFSVEDFQAVLDAAQNIVKVINVLIEALPEKTKGIVKKIGFI